MNTLITSGLAILSTATSAKDRWAAGSYELSVGTVISPDLRNPKKPRQQAAHSMTVRSDSHTTFIFLRMSGEMGNLWRTSIPFLASALLTPCNVYCSRGKPGSKGSLAPGDVALLRGRLLWCGASVLTPPCVQQTYRLYPLSPVQPEIPLPRRSAGTCSGHSDTIAV